MQREAADGAEIRRDVVAPFAVPPSGSQDNFAFFIAKADGNAVNLGFDRPVEFCFGQEFMDPPDKISHFGLGVGVVKAHHTNRMPDGDEFAHGVAADSLSGGFRGNELRKGRFEFDEFLIKPVVFPVRNGGVRQNVIGVVVPSDLFGKLPVFSFSVFGIHALASHRARRLPLNKLAGKTSDLTTIQHGKSP